MSEEPQEQKRKLSKTGIVIAFLPFAVFVAMAGLFFKQLESETDPSLLPSVLLNKPAPVLDMPALEGSDKPALVQALVDQAAKEGKVTLVNVWASWCIPCRQEAPDLLELAKDPRINLVGINYKDKNDNALRFLGELGNPFAAIGVDPKGAAAIDWGVYGIPETYLVDKTGHVVYKKVGPFSPENVQKELMPQIEKALAAKG